LTASGVVYKTCARDESYTLQPMYIRWQSRKRRRSQYGDWRKSDVHWSAILVENARVDGKPKQRHVAYLAGFTESAIKIMAQRCHLWDQIDHRLDRLSNQITSDDRAKIETVLAARIPRPTTAEYKDSARKAAELLGWEGLSEKRRAALKDERELWENSPSDVSGILRRRQSALS
jgi:hypothetical protein